MTTTNNLGLELVSGTETFDTDKVKNNFTEIDTAVGNPESLTTTEKTDLVAAINEVDGNIGDLSGLSTTAKENLVSAVNELNQNKVIKKTYTNIATDSYGFFSIESLKSDISNGYSIIGAFAKDAAFDQNGSSALPVFSVDNSGGTYNYGYLYKASGTDITVLSGALNVTMVIILAKL